MSQKILNARATYVLVLLTVGLFPACIGWQVEARAQVETTGSVMLFVPSDPQLIEDKFNPKNLVEMGVLDLGVTTEWSTISELGNSGQLKALIIHHAALGEVEGNEVSTWFRNNRVVVTGLGIQGDQLAELVGMPGLYSSPSSYPNEEFFYTYAYVLKGSPEEVLLFAGDDGSPDFKAEGVKSQLFRSSSFVTDSLLEDSDAKRMLLVTKERIEQQDDEY